MKHVLLAGFVCACAIAQPKPGTGSIAGRVLDSITGVPIRKATVNLRSANIGLTAQSDSEGRFQFTALPARTYKLAATHLGFLDHAARRPIVLAEDGHVIDAEIRLPPQGVISGRALDEDGDPVGGAQINLFRRVFRDGIRSWDSFGPGTTAITNEAGEYRLPNLSPGRYLIRARAQGPAPNSRFGEPSQLENVFVYYPNVLAEESASPVEVGVGADVRGVDIHLFRVASPPRYRITGKVIGAPPGAEIDILGALARPPDYLFDTSISAGQRTIIAHVYSGGPEAYAMENINVTGNISGLVLTMSPPPEVSARLRLAESDRQVDLKGARLSLNRHPRFIDDQDALSDATGKFTLLKPIAPGHFSINIRSLPAGCFVQTITVGKQEVSGDGFDILASTPLDIVLSDTAGAITGSVSDDDHKPFPNSTITLILSDAKSRPVTQTADDDGNFKFTNLRPGKYELFAWEEVDDGLWPDSDFRKKYEALSTKITVGPRETQSTQLTVILTEKMK